MATFVTVDIIIETEGGIPLVRRKHAPFQGFWAIPGGIVEEDETVEQAALREALEETGLRIGSLRLLGVYSDPGRDPRGRSISIAFIGSDPEGRAKAGSDAAEVAIFKEGDLPADLAFDHAIILKDYLSLTRAGSPKEK
jgi:8-oxo-dGTP diphosphatase